MNVIELKAVMIDGSLQTVAFLQMDDIYEVIQQYKKERRDKYDVYGFLEYCLKKEAIRIEYTKKNAKLTKDATVVNFTEEMK